MKASASLTGQDLERLWLTIDTSIKVTQRFQFFLWVQGNLQSFIPHETLVCGLGDLAGPRLRHEIFSRLVIEPKLEAALHHPSTSIVPPLADAWHNAGRKPLCFRADEPQEALRQHFGGQHALCHGAGDASSQHGSLFAFLGLPGPPGAREAYVVDLLMPHLHMALLRMCDQEEGGARPLPVDIALSEREIQVLAWVRDGKTNVEIGQLLDISPLTVKNHVQRLLRKLNAANRAQAVAKAVAIGLLRRQGRNYASDPL